jgi:hypothetical protein
MVSSKANVFWEKPGLHWWEGGAWGQGGREILAKMITPLKNIFPPIIMHLQSKIILNKF